MTMPLARSVTVLACFGLLGACESDARRLDRLQTEAAVARLEVTRLEEASQRIVLPTLEARQARAKSLADSLAAARTRATLADRDLARFLVGR
jgi:hypothetical protein